MRSSVRVKLLAAIIICLNPSACSEVPELKQNNNPDNYRAERDLLWASPDDFDLTMDIYTPRSGKASYPVIVMFHGEIGRAHV